MFKEDADWSDEEEAQRMTKPVFPDSKKTNSNPNAKSKVVGRKSLMRTLQTLGSIPEWKSEDHQQEDSDSDGTRSPCKKKRKKKRNRKRKSTEISEEHQENGEDADKSVEENKVGAKKRKKDAKFSPLKAQNKSSSEQGKKNLDSAEVKENHHESANKLSRQQWKTKMKNKRKCKNKYRQEKPEEEVEEAAAKQQTEEDFKTDVNNEINGEQRSWTTTQKKEVGKKISLNTEMPESGAEKQQMTKDRNTTKCEKEKKNALESKNNLIPEQQQKKQKVELSKDQSLKREKLRKLLQGVKTDQQEVPTEQEDEPEVPEVEEEKVEVDVSDSTSLRSRMEQRLESARFRYINEVLYTTSSGEAKRMFTQDPQAFWVYHKGYTAQVQRWPSNPVDDIISFIRQKSSSLVVADFGCGDCKIARGVKNKVHSFDLASTCELVTVCDMAHVPLKDSSVDIGVFCLSLMGTNLAEFIAEANRVLKRGGILKVAEVASRFEDVRNFVSALSSLGFKLVSKNTDNTHFYSFEFVKTGSPKENIKKFGLQLKPCVYKKR
ncbi:ribosomal RNA-processing protein 8 [Gouania willdenowi]|uniref:Ribosomal RNA-processing protein 8 n=1 Tax=Gouania willdenowi TaxID=441366 RepID=A0A8C5GUW6_GOUWI|nr:ribosomal RNA-processing protein 8 [Gouania willdenowi]XP_028320477.1 ribosomal RNA-processing protein 8 [Gouania willdenowi]